MNDNTVEQLSQFVIVWINNVVVCSFHWSDRGNHYTDRFPSGQNIRHMGIRRVEVGRVCLFLNEVAKQFSYRLSLMAQTEK